ncbi:hypothetical protein DH2020_036425 [Rehmannia glutinosa]|uniref:F-box/kelch-repeat protein SKIP25 n=1 Tax=Rehmannia glutinosa TaxID=99300 RepID=A0ABR0V6B1_REHGL
MFVLTCRLGYGIGGWNSIHRQKTEAPPGDGGAPPPRRVSTPRTPRPHSSTLPFSRPPSIIYSVCHSWRRLIYSPSFPPFLSLYALIVPTETQIHNSNSVELCSFDPISRKWHLLPPPPSDPPLRFLFRHPSFISRKLPIQSVAASGNLVVLAATDDNFLPALSEPLIFNPLSRNWDYGQPLSAPRRWCAAGASRGSVYVASGMGSHYNTDVARSIEKGKLCMVNVKGDAAKEGIIYDVETDCWEEMPEGMLAGWRGPAAAMDEETIYVVDESKGLLKKYDHVNDAWMDVAENYRLKGAQQVAAAGGKVCVLCADGVSITVVDVAATPPVRLWVVDVPAGIQIVGVHILPRMIHS